MLGKAVPPWHPACLHILQPSARFGRMLHVWLLPALAIVVVVLAAFYLIVKFTGGTGVRSSGRTLVDKPEDEDHG
jgi:hypothetical protein